jgi:hypothetical protein
VHVSSFVCRWEPQEFGECSESCRSATSIRTRPVICRQQQGDGVFATVANSVCEREDIRRKPATTESCGVECVRYFWQEGPWSPCSVQCGRGTETRSLRCLEESPTTQLRVSNFECTSRRLYKPIEERSCSPTPRCRYNLTRWSKCSVTCGLGKQTREVSCIKLEEGFSRTIDIEHCDNDASLLQPYTVRECYTGVCPCVGPRWVPRAWSPCTRTCGGGGTQQRDARCYCFVDGQLQQVRDEICDIDQKPPLSQTCGEIDCPCINPRWRSGWWNQCPVTCGQGIERRNVSCVCTRDGDVQLTTEQRCFAHPRPRSERACYRSQCPCENPSWGTSAWSACSKPCNGRRSRTVTCNCEVANRYRVEDDVCYLYLRTRNISRPTEEERCGGPCQCENYRYRAGDWSHCSVTCGPGNRTRTVSCWCDIDGVPKRRDTQECMANIGSSPTAVELCNSTCSCMGYYVTEPWKPCSDPCGGTRVRNVTCLCEKDEEFVVLTANSCDSVRAPVTVENCEPCEYSWYSTSWKACTPSCRRHRNVYCADQHGNRKKDSYCYEFTDDYKPNERERCTYTGSQDEHISWSASAWSRCSKMCGGGFKRRTVTCLNQCQRQKASGCRKELRPPHLRVCNDFPCDLSTCKDRRNRNYCALIERLNLCSREEFGYYCCATCLFPSRVIEDYRG